MTRAVTDLAIARDVVGAWGFDPNATLDLLAVSENSTYRVSDAAHSGILRVHRPGYHTAAGIRTELAWLERLADDPAIPVANPLRTTTGDALVTSTITGRARFAVMVEPIKGETRDDATVSASDFFTLGRFAALLHQDIRAHGIPGTGERIEWDWEHMHGTQPRWGRWQDGPGVTPAIEATIDAAAGRAHDALLEYGTGPDRYSFIHSDLRQSNVLFRPNGVTLIDFDDCGYGWNMYDFAGATSFLESDSRLLQWRHAWVAGYRTEAELTLADEQMLDTFVLVRRLMLLAWLGSHNHSVESARLADGFAAATADLAAGYLATGTLAA